MGLDGSRVSFRQEIVEKETVPFHYFTVRKLNRPGEYRPVENKGVKFPVFPAGVDPAWKVVKKRHVETASPKGLIKHL